MRWASALYTKSIKRFDSLCKFRLKFNNRLLREILFYFIGRSNDLFLERPKRIQKVLKFCHAIVVQCVGEVGVSFSKTKTKKKAYLKN